LVQVSNNPAIWKRIRLRRESCSSDKIMRGKDGKNPSTRLEGKCQQDNRSAIELTVTPAQKVKFLTQALLTGKSRLLAIAISEVYTKS
jgi:hypothetical protein